MTESPITSRTTSSSSTAVASSSLNVSSAFATASCSFALRASAMARSYNRAFSIATEAWPASTSSIRTSSSGNWSIPSLETTITPITRVP